MQNFSGNGLRCKHKEKLREILLEPVGAHLAASATDCTEQSNHYGNQHGNRHGTGPGAGEGPRKARSFEHLLNEFGHLEMLKVFNVSQRVLKRLRKSAQRIDEKCSKYLSRVLKDFL